MKFSLRSGASTAASVLIAAAVSSAQASPVRINTGSDFNLDPDGSTRTSAFQQIGFTGTLNTSAYLGNPASVGTIVVATNIPSIMNFYGFSAGTHATIDGGSRTFTYANAPSQNNFDTLNNPLSPNLNGFTGGVAFPQYGTGAIGGIGGAWGLTTSYQVVGTTVDTNGDTIADRINYTSGIFSIFYQSAINDPNNGKEVLRLIVSGSDETRLHGYFDFSYAAGDAFVQNFVEDVHTGSTLFSLWQSAPDTVGFDIDFSTLVSPPSELWNAGVSLVSQSILDGALSLNTPLPEPASLLLVAAALAGAGTVRRRSAR